MIIRIFQILSVVFAAAAAYFWWADNFDFAFAGLVLAICAFFLSIRFLAKTRNEEVAQTRSAANKSSIEPE